MKAAFLLILLLSSCTCAERKLPVEDDEPTAVDIFRMSHAARPN